VCGHSHHAGVRLRRPPLGITGYRHLVSAPYIVSLASMVRFLVGYEMPKDQTAFDRHYRDVHIPLAEADHCRSEPVGRLGNGYVDKGCW
jgi:hypothetical protein